MKSKFVQFFIYFYERNLEYPVKILHEPSRVAVGYHPQHDFDVRLNNSKKLYLAYGYEPYDNLRKHKKIIFVQEKFIDNERNLYEKEHLLRRTQWRK